ncbi:MAG: adenylate/guanylate cyclase domain-containing protein, partial [Bauldia sp.]
MTSTGQAKEASAGPPQGTVTFLFTDIEGSTRLVLELGAIRWAPILERHRAILRAAIEASSGLLVQTEGDSVFAVFSSAPAAVAASAAAQRGIAAEEWPLPDGITVRMGLHSGEGALDADGSYVGADVHRAARVASAAHGGQVLLSDAVRVLVAPSLPEGIAIADLGEHRLKDLRPERLYQLRIEGLRQDFPPIKSLDARPNNLPVPLTSFVGRDQELREVAELLRMSRLLTLSGPGGTGKTRLSLQLAAEAAADFPAGVWFVALEPIRDPALVASTIAHTLGLTLNSNRPALQAIADTIGGKPVLLVLDNFEQVADGAPVVPELLRACPNLRVIVTSRIALRVSGEQEYQVPGLPVPPDLSRLSRIERENLPASLRTLSVSTLSHFEAVRLFIARATAVRPAFIVTNDNAPAIAQICARLHGMPLAIELAAVRVKLLTPDQILERLEQQLKLLTSGGRDLPARQQTLRGAIAWSYDLLDPALRDFMARLSVFSGGWDLAAAEAVAADGIDVLEGLSTLVDHSLVRQEETGGIIRFEMFPTIREYAMEHLTAAGADRALAERHARYYTAFVEEAAKYLAGDEQRKWLDAIEREHDNIRSALDWSTASPDPETAIRLAFAAWRFFQMRGYLGEGRARLEAMAAMDWHPPPPVQARLFEALGGIAYWQADYLAAIKWYDRALEIWRAEGNRSEIANAIYNRAFTEILPLVLAQAPSTGRVDDESAARVLTLSNEALAIYRDLGDRNGEANILWATGGLRYFGGKPDESEPFFRDA